MALQEAILAIADRMEEDIKQWGQELSPAATLMIRSYMNELRTAVKASHSDVPSNSPIWDPYATVGHHQVMIDKAREEFSKEGKGQKLLSDFQERNEPKMCECMDGPSKGIMVPIDQKMPVGAHTLVNDVTYTLRKDGNLYLRSTVE